VGDYNRVILCGRLGRDAEVRHTAGGQTVATLNVATSETWKDKDGEKQERTEWSRCVVWGKTAEALERYLVKGKQVLIEGSLQTRKWEDKNGVERYTTEIKVHRVVLLGSAGESNGGSRRDSGDQRRGRGNDEGDQRRGNDGIETQGPVGGWDEPDDDIPF
jgi:single-strand DNA-binding protein